MPSAPAAMKETLPLARSATELRSLAPYTPQHIHRLEKAGRFPKRPQLGPNRVGWRLTDIEAWIKGAPIRIIAD